MLFVDWTKVFVKSGAGGKGCTAFRREKHVPKGGPSGGDGGRGGDIIIRVDNNLFTLQDIKYHKSYKAKNGGAGQGSRKTGQDAKPVIINVPPGTVISDKDSGVILADLAKKNDSFIVAIGGKGGRGNANFATSTNRAPRYAEQGIPGEEKNLVFELKVISDVGLVGFPNAGKSTLISKLSAARPKIASYPFTTLVPNLGIVKYGTYRSFIMADIPGLIEGAHQGKGLGHRFLRHLERTKVLVFLIEATEKDIIAQYQTLNAELDKYLDIFSDKPRLIALTKTDIISEVNLPQISKIDVIPISAINGDGLNNLVDKIVKLLGQNG
ncbi:MAG: GTPase ObgE [Candidatus Marinimicrobia bacterium]|nr:GTPase ObgE [Candidatus Neomarinimicrobiota bacterium]